MPRCVMTRLPRVSLRITVLAAYIFMMMTMGFLHQPGAGVSAFAAAFQATVSDIQVPRTNVGDEPPAVADHVAMGHMPGQRGEVGSHKQLHRSQCDVYLANTGHAPPAEAPAIDKPGALTENTHTVPTSLALKETGIRIALPRTPPAIPTA